MAVKTALRRPQERVGAVETLALALEVPLFLTAQEPKRRQSRSLSTLAAAGLWRAPTTCTSRVSGTFGTGRIAVFIGRLVENQVERLDV